MPKTFFFDIETGGKRAWESSILSLGVGTQEEGVRPTYAAPTTRSQLYRWSEKKIWEPIRELGAQGKAKIGTEQELLEGFFSKLEKNPGATLAGWNIGTRAQAAGPGVTGFDVPFLMRRAREYGLEDRAQRAFAGTKMWDVGAEYSYKIAEAVERHGAGLVEEGVLHKDLFESARGYMKQARVFEHQYGVGRAQLPEELHKAGVRVSGWQLGTVHEAMGFGKIAAHEVAADVQATMRLGEAVGTELDEAFVRRWAPLAFENKIVSTLKAPPYDPTLATPQRFMEFMGSAAQMEARGGAYTGVQQRILTELEEQASIVGGSMAEIRAGRGLSEAATRIGESRAATAASRIGLGEGLQAALDIAKANKGKIGIGVGVAALWALQPGQWFSGKDDAYNTIEGLPHGGMSEKMRRTLTDFGSGWVGSTVWGLRRPLAREEFRQYMSAADDSYNTIEGLGHRGISGGRRRVHTDFGSGFTEGLKSLWKGIKQKPGQIKRTFEVASLINKEGNRAVAKITKEIAHGAKAGKPLEIGVAGLTVAKAGYMLAEVGMGTLTPGGVALGLGTFVGTKWAYEAIKKRQALKAAWSFAKANPLETKLGAKVAGGEVAEQVGRYIRTGERNVASTYIRTGGGEYGAQSVIAHLEGMSPATRASEMERIAGSAINRIGGADDFYNVIEGLQHGGMAEALRKMLTDFGSGWIRQALKRGISREEIVKKFAQEMSDVGISGARQRLAGTGVYGLSQADFMKKAMATRTEEGFVRFLRGAHRVQGDAEKFLVTTSYRAGGMGQTFMVRGMQSGRRGIYKTARTDRSVGGEMVTGQLMTGPAFNLSIGGRGASQSQFFEALRNEMRAGPAANRMNYVDEYMGQMRETARTVSGGKHNMSFEAAMTRQAREEMGELAPEVLGQTKRGFIQEFAGVPLPHDKRSIPALEKMKDIWGDVLTSTGERVRHFDPQIENVVRQGTKLRMIDFGVAARGPALTRESQAAAQRILDDYVTILKRELDPANFSPPSGSGSAGVGGPLRGPSTGAGRPRAMAAQAAGGGTGSVDQGAADLMAKKAAALAGHNVKGVATAAASPKAMQARQEAAKTVATTQLRNPPAPMPATAGPPAKTKKIEWSKRHREATMRASINAKEPGRRHRRHTTGTLVL